MSLSINKKQMLEIRDLASAAGQPSLKKLNEKEKKAIQVMMKALQHGEETANVKLEDSDLTHIKEFLGQQKEAREKGKATPSHPSDTMGKILKFIKNTLGIRTSTAKLKEEIAKAGGDIFGKEIRERADIIHQFNVAYEFALSFNLKEYSDIEDFLKNLPNDQKPAQHEIHAKLAEVEEKISVLEASKDPDKKDKLRVLKDQILPKLSALANEEKSFFKKLNETQPLFNTEQMKKNLLELKKPIDARRKEIEKLSRQEAKHSPRSPADKHLVTAFKDKIYNLKDKLVMFKYQIREHADSRKETYAELTWFLGQLPKDHTVARRKIANKREELENRAKATRTGEYFNSYQDRKDTPPPVLKKRDDLLRAVDALKNLEKMPTVHDFNFLLKETKKDWSEIAKTGVIDEERREIAKLQKEIRALEKKLA